VRGMPGIGAWTAHREFPAPAKRSFMAMYKDSGGER
jgi:L-lactate dehydrogenase complex protein LldF